VTVFAVGENISQMSEFRDVFGMRFVGLVDSSGVYQAYRVPNPQAPYPQDYVIDQQGVVRYWADQFDPQEVITVIDRLLSSGFEEEKVGADVGATISAVPNPFRVHTAISLPPTARGQARLAVFDVGGRVVRTLVCTRPPRPAVWNGTNDRGTPLPAGVYYLAAPGSRPLPVTLLR
jgi:hypothetical protein